MYMDVAIIYKNGQRANLKFAPSNELYLSLTDFIVRNWGCDSFMTCNLTQHDIDNINAVDDYLKSLLKEGCYLDVDIHRSIFIEG